jgi:hypothetical protein
MMKKKQDNGYYPPKNLQFLLIKTLQKIGVYNLIQEINWPEPILFGLEGIKGDIRVAYAHDYIFLAWEVEYLNEVIPKRDWYILNEMNNPFAQPSILLHENNEDKHLVLWSKENYRALTLEDMHTWFETFMQVVVYVHDELLNYTKNATQTADYAKYHDMLEY